MVTIVDIIRAVSGRIETLFGEPPTTKDVTEGFDRPCTYVQPALMRTAVEGELRHDSFSVEILRFADRTRKGYLDLLNCQATLADALEKPIPVTEHFFVYPEEVAFDLRREEMLLIASFSIENFQLLSPEDDEMETMEILVLKE